MLDYARDVQTFVGGMDAVAFAEDRKTQYAVLQALSISRYAPIPSAKT
jgi:uncharacterized protein with HEPN domain